ncbi:MAG: hypothetical protein ACE5R6_10545 [Candidatus Heimdallarchaeota archaeon]
MDSFLDNTVNSDKQFLLELLVGGYILSFTISYVGSFPVGVPPASLGVILEGIFTTLTIYSAIVSAWILYLAAERTPHFKIFLVVSFIIIVTTSLLLISANFFSHVTHYLRVIAVLSIGITPMVSFVMLHEVFSEKKPGQRGSTIYLLSMALFLLSWGIHTALFPFRLPNILEISLISLVAFLYNVVALVSLILAIQLAQQEGKKLRFLLLPSLIYVAIGVSIGLYLQRNALEYFRLFEMIISEPWRWTIGYDMPLFSMTYNYIFYVVFPAAVLPLGWIFLKSAYKTHAHSWKYVLFGWLVLFVCGAGSSDAYEMIGKLIGYSLLLLGFFNLLSIEKGRS